MAHQACLDEDLAHVRIRSFVYALDSKYELQMETATKEAIVTMLIKEQLFVFAGDMQKCVTDRKSLQIMDLPSFLITSILKEFSRWQRRQEHQRLDRDIKSQIPSSKHARGIPPPNPISSHAAKTRSQVAKAMTTKSVAAANHESKDEAIRSGQVLLAGRPQIRLASSSSSSSRVKVIVSSPLPSLEPPPNRTLPNLLKESETPASTPSTIPTAAAAAAGVNYSPNTDRTVTDIAPTKVVSATVTSKPDDVVKKEEEDSTCAICLEPLRGGAHLQLQDCGHQFHEHCLRAKIKAGWPGARITFDFLGCALCRVEMRHESLSPALEPFLKLRARIKGLALDRLKYERLEDHKEILDKGGRFYQDPSAFAMHYFMFYRCHVCNEPYFAGGYECQEAGADFNEEDLLCPSCQPVDIQDCPKHGKQWLAFKCRFCCNVSSWQCWGNTHFCRSCHVNGTWQKYVSYRSGRNKLELWEYPQCPGISRQIEALPPDISLEDKRAKCHVMWSQPSLCPRGLKHPINGVEFGLGCIMCGDGSKTNGVTGALLGKARRRNHRNNGRKEISSADDIKEEEGAGGAAAPAFKGKKQQQKKRRPRRKDLLHIIRGLPKAGRKFTYTGQDFDDSGILHYLGSGGGQCAWENPCSKLDCVRISTSGLLKDSKPAHYAVGRDVVRCVTNPVLPSWFQFEFIGVVIRPTHYSVRHYDSWDTECLRNWRFEASNDGKQWHVLTRHVNDTSIPLKVGATATFKIAAAAEDDDGNNGGKAPRYCYGAYRFFRLITTGKNSNGNLFLPLSGFELFGTLFNADNVDGGQHPPPQYNGRGDVGIQPKAEKTTTFVYTSDFDEHGIFYFLGTKAGQLQNWENPAAAINMVQVRSTSLAIRSSLGSQPAHMILGRTTDRIMTVAAPNMWFEVKMLHGFRAKVGRYTLRHYKTRDSEALRNWVLEASNDGQHWTTIKEHVNDTALKKAGQSYTWAIESARSQQYFNTFRIRQTGLNSSGHLYLALSGFEIYGDLTTPPLFRRKSSVGREAKRGDVSQSRSSSKHPVKIQQQQPQKQPEQLRREILLEHDQHSGGPFQKNGLFHFLGTKYGTTGHWANPSKLGYAALTSSIVGSKSEATEVLLGKEAVRWVTKPCLNAFFQVTLKTCQIRPTSYALRHYVSWDKEALRNWRLEGKKGSSSPSGKGEEWMVLSEHTNDEALNAKGSEAIWPLETKEFFDSFRVVQVGMNSNMHYFLACSGIELYGQVKLSKAAAEMMAAAPSGNRSPETEQQNVNELTESSSGAASSSQLEFKYSGVDFDEQGIVYAIGTGMRSRTWKNPGESGAIVVTSSPLAERPASVPAWGILGRSTVRCVTKQAKRSYFKIDFRTVKIRPTAYSLRHYSSWDSEAVRNWRLEGSNNDRTWTTIREHKDDGGLDGKGSTFTWRLNTPEFFRIFRIFQTGQNSNGHWFLALSGFEIYGSLIVD